MSVSTWQKSSYCAQGEACVHIAATWQKSSYCAQGNSCVHVSTPAGAGTPAIRLTESGDPTGAIVTATPHAFGALLAALKKEPPHA